jgi:hypothetical protein
MLVFWRRAIRQLPDRCQSSPRDESVQLVDADVSAHSRFHQVGLRVRDHRSRLQSAIRNQHRCLSEEAEQQQQQKSSSDNL